MQKESLPKLGFDYEPYHYGPYSRQLDSLLKTLQLNNLVRKKTTFTHNLNICRTFKLTPSGKKTAETYILNTNQKLVGDVTSYVDKFKSATPSQMLKHVYEEYPDMTRNSVLLTPDDDVFLKRYFSPISS